MRTAFRRLAWRRGGWALPRWRALALAGVCLVALAGCGQLPLGGGGDVAVWHLPADWHEITPPDGRSIASYAISPDVPGLIVACIGDPVNHTSASPMGPATLWRTRDGGVHWQALDVTDMNAGCEVLMPRGGQGTIYVANTLVASAPDSLIVSHDAGTTWHVLPPLGPDLGDFLPLIQRSVIRDGQLYAIGEPGVRAAPSQPGPAFSVSDDDGTTWTRLESGNDPLLRRGYAPLAWAADYRAPDAWYRLLTFNDGNGNETPGPPTLEHSADGGRTWQVVGTAGTPALLMGATSYLSGWLATTPAAPARLCLGLEAFISNTALRSGNVPVAASVSGLAWPRAPHGPPAPLPLNDILAGSDDGGATWQGAIVAEHRRDYGRIADPGVATDAQGACVAADSSGQALESQDTTAHFFRLVPGAGAQPATIGAFSELNVSLATVFQASAGGDERLLALTTASIIRSCSYSCADGSVNDVSSPHLIWTSPVG